MSGIFQGATSISFLTSFFVSPNQRTKKAQPQLCPTKIVSLFISHFSNSFLNFVYSGFQGFGISGVSVFMFREINFFLVQGIQCLLYVLVLVSIAFSSSEGHP